MNFFRRTPKPVIPWTQEQSDRANAVAASQKARAHHLQNRAIRYYGTLFFYDAQYAAKCASRDYREALKVARRPVTA
jgi:hypothetical protein